MKISTREYSVKLLDMVEEGILDKDAVICAMVNYLSESDVRNMMEVNEFISEDDDEDEDDE